MDPQLHELIKATLQNPGFFTISSGYINNEVIKERLAAVKEFYKETKAE